MVPIPYNRHNKCITTASGGCAKQSMKTRSASTPRKRPAIARDSTVPLYLQIADRLARDIDARRYKPGQRIGSEAELMAQFAVSRVTVRQAIGMLIEQNRLVVKQGKGTFVAGAHVTYHFQGIKGFYDTLVAQGLHPDTDLVKFAEVAVPPRLAGYFGRGVRTIVQLQRKYSVSGQPMALADLYLVVDPARVSRRHAAEHPSYWLLEELMGLKIGRADVRIRVQPADAATGRLLGVRAGTQTLVMERISFGADERPLEHATFFIRPEAYEFRLGVVGPLPIGSRISQANHFSPARKNGRRRIRSGSR